MVVPCSILSRLYIDALDRSCLYSIVHRYNASFSKMYYTMIIPLYFTETRLNPKRSNQSSLRYTH